MNIGGIYGKVKEQETDVLRSWKRLDLPFKVGYPHRPRRTAAKVLAKKKNWSAPGPDRLANFWWKRAESLHVGVATAFQAISSIDGEYPPGVLRGENVSDSQTWGVNQ